MSQQPDINKSYIYTKDLNEAKYQFLIKKCEDVRTKHWNDSKTFIEFSIDMIATYKTIEDYNPTKKLKISIVFDNMIADMINNKKLNPIVTE